MRLLKKIRHLPKRSQLTLLIFAIVAVCLLGLFIWSIITGKIRPFAQGNEIINTAVISYQDSSGASYSSSSNTVITQLVTPTPSPTLTSPTPTPSLFPTTSPTPTSTPTSGININLKFKLQGRTDHSATNVNLEVFGHSDVTPIIVKNDITADSSGQAQTIIPDLIVGQYDFRLKVNSFLSAILSNIMIADNQLLDFGTLKAGDLDNNNIVNSLDFSRLIAKWGMSDPATDINQDGTTNTIDFSFLNFNWFAQGR